MNHVSSGRVALVKTALVSVVTLLGIGISLAYAEPLSGNAAPGHLSANQYNWTAGGGG